MNSWDAIAVRNATVEVEIEEPSSRVFWDELVPLEPRLRPLLDTLRSFKPHRFASFCANTVWYGYAGESGIKPQLLPLIGYGRRDDPLAPLLLKTEAAYDAAYQFLWHHVPSCNHEGSCCGPLVRIEDAPTSVYLCFDETDCLLYVGITNGGARRGVEHASSKVWWHEVAWQKWEHFGTREEAIAREAELILNERPPFNIQIPKPPKGLRKR